MSAEITAIAERRYEKLKAQIRQWVNDRFAIGEALREIRDGELYKHEYPTFEAFCLTEYDFKVRRAYQLIEAAEVKASLKNVQHVAHLENPRQAAALAAVPEEDRETVLETAAETGKVTAKSITEAAAKVAPAAPPKPTKAIHLDKTGYPIPDGILDDWERAEGFGATLRRISEIKCLVDDGLKDDDYVLFAEITNSTIATLKNAYSELAQVIPYAVCPTCQGHNRDSCTLCRRRGFLSRFKFETCVPEDLRKIREAKCKR